MTEFLAELRRRRVLPMAGAYIAIAWLATEIASFLLAQAGAPSASARHRLRRWFSADRHARMGHPGRT